MKLNVLLNCSVTAACLFANVVDNAKAMEPEDTWNKPITRAMIQEGLETYQKYQTPQTSDLLALTQQGNDGKDPYKVKLFALQNLHVKSKKGEEMPLLLVNTLKNDNTGQIDILEWDQALGDKNYEIVDQETYNKGNGSLYFHERYCATLDYSFNSTFGNDVQVYALGRGYCQDYLCEPLRYCYVKIIRTDAAYQNKGLGKLCLSELIKFAFHSTSIDFINAYIKEDNTFSELTFKSNYFEQLHKFNFPKMPNYEEVYKFTNGNMSYMTLDGGMTYIYPKFFPDNINGIDSNWYLSRIKWKSYLPSTKGSNKGAPLYQYNQDLAKIEMELGTSLFSSRSDEWKARTLEFAKRNPVNCLKCIQKVKDNQKEKENALKQEIIIPVMSTSQAPQVNLTEEQ